MESGRLWLVSRVLLGVSLVPLLISVWLLADPISNPGVQRCGSPGMFVVSGRLDTALPIPGDAGYSDETPALVAQPSCSMRVNDRFETALWIGGVFGVLALAGAIIGLVDDRMALYHAPRFESLLRERPANAPGFFWDRPVVPADDLGSRLPDIERSDLRTLWIVPLVMWVSLTIITGYRAVFGALGSPVVSSLIVLVALWMVAVASVALRFWVISPPSRNSGWEIGNDALVALATCLVARIRPSFGWSGSWLHHRVRAGEDRSRAIFEVSTVASLSVVVHVTVTLIAGIVVLATGVARHGIDWRIWLVVIVLLVLVLRGGSSSAARYHQLFGAPGPAGLRALGVLARRDTPRFVGLVVTSVVQCVVEAVGLVVALRIVGVDVSTPTIVFVALLATTVGPLGPFTDGIGVVEPFAVVALWRFGVEPAAAVAAVFIWRMTIRWAPMIPGAIAQVVLTRSAIGVGPGGSGFGGSGSGGSGSGGSGFGGSGEPSHARG